MKWCFAVPSFAPSSWEASHPLIKAGKHLQVAFHPNVTVGFDASVLCLLCEAIGVDLLRRCAEQINPPCLASRQRLRNEKLSPRRSHRRSPAASGCVSLSTTRWASAFIFQQQNHFVLPVILKSNKLWKWGKLPGGFGAVVASVEI